MKFTKDGLQRTVATLFAASAVILGSVSMASPASAARACTNPARVGFGAGLTAYSPAIFGTRAQIEYNNPDLCGSDADDVGVSSAWSMVTAHSISDPNDPDRDNWAQAGYLQAGAASPFTTGIYVFAQWTYKCKSYGSCTGTQVHTEYYGPVSVPHTYTNYRISSTGKVRMNVDGQFITETNYDPSGDWSSAWSGQFAGEAHDRGTDIPGTAADVTGMNQIQKMSSSSSWSYFENLNGFTTPNTRYHRDVRNSTSGNGLALDVWTDPL